MSASCTVGVVYLVLLAQVSPGLLLAAAAAEELRLYQALPISPNSAHDRCESLRPAASV